jgi:hypothetical protein
MTGISLCVAIWNHSSGFSVQHLYRESVVRYNSGDLEFSGKDIVNWDRVVVAAIIDVKEFDVKRYEITLANGAMVILEEYLY